MGSKTITRYNFTHYTILCDIPDNGKYVCVCVCMCMCVYVCACTCCVCVLNLVHVTF